MPKETLTIELTLPAATALLIYGVQLAEMNKKCEPVVSEGLNQMSHDIWKELTLRGDPGIVNFNKYVMKKHFPGATGIDFS